MAKFEIWQTVRDEQWHWHLKSEKNGNIICWAEPYSSKQAVLESIEFVKVNASDAKIVG